MKTNPHTSLLFALLLGPIASLSAAPIAVGAGAGGGVGANIGVAHGLGGGAAFGGATHVGGGFSGMSNAQVGLGSAAAGHGAAATGKPDLGIDTGEFETIGMRQAHLGENTSSEIAAGMPAEVVAHQHAAVAALTETNATEIRTATPDTRAKVTADMKARMTGLAKALSEVKAHSASLTAEQRIGFNAAMQDVDVRAKTVKQDMKATAKASDETRADAQAKLADDYEAYVQAAQHAEAIATAASTAKVQGTAAARGTIKG